MPARNRLPANVISNLGSLPVGKHGDGGGLWLLRRPDGGAQWSLRYTIGGKSGEMGLGSAADVSLAKAREEAKKWRGLALSGVNPRLARQRERREAAVTRPTVAEVVAATFEARKGQLKAEGAAGRWDSPLRTLVLPKLGKTAIADVTQESIRETLAPVWHNKPSAAEKALNRLRLAFRHAVAMGLEVDLAAPDRARILLGAQRHKAEHIPALGWREVPAFYASLAGGSITENALRFVVLTAARSGEVRGATWDEFDLDAKVWSIPAARMKAGRPHRIPLSPEALRVLEAARPASRAGFVFPGTRGPISDMTMSRFMSRRGLEARPHGFRSSFRDWCADVAPDVPREVAETALAHVTADDTEAAYRRSDFLERRRALMARWADHVVGKGAAKVVRLARGSSRSARGGDSVA